MQDDLRQDPPRRVPALYHVDCLRCGQKATAGTYALVKRMVRAHVCQRRQDGADRVAKPEAQ